MNWQMRLIYLHQRRYLIISHTHADHISELNKLKETALREVKYVWVPGASEMQPAEGKKRGSRNLWGKTLDTYKNVIVWVNEVDVDNIVDASGKETFKAADKPMDISAEIGCQDASFYIVYAAKNKLTPQKPDELNDTSLVLLVVYKPNGGRPWTALFTGDLEKMGEKATLTNLQKFIDEDPIKKEIGEQFDGLDFFSLPHHGSRGSSNNFFIEYLKPKMAFVSAGLEKSYRHPRCSALWRVEKVIPETSTGAEKKIFCGLDVDEIQKAGKKRKRDDEEQGKPAFDQWTTTKPIYSTRPFANRYIQQLPPSEVRVSQSDVKVEDGITWSLSVSTMGATVSPSCNVGGQLVAVETFSGGDIKARVACVDESNGDQEADLVNTKNFVISEGEGVKTSDSSRPAKRKRKEDEADIEDESPAKRPRGEDTLEGDSDIYAGALESEDKQRPAKKARRDVVSQDAVFVRRSGDAMETEEVTFKRPLLGEFVERILH